MGLTDIRTEVKRTTDKVRLFSTADIDAAVNGWYLTCWRRLDGVAPHRTRITQSLALVADQLTAYTLSTAPLAIIYVQPPHANRNDRTFLAAIADDEFYRHESQKEIWYAQEGEDGFIIRPAIDAALTVTVHYIRTPPTITTSVNQLHFADQTLAAGAIGRLLHSINFADAFYWIDERNPRRPTGAAYTLQQDEMKVFQKFGYNSNAVIQSAGAFFNR